MTTILTNLYKKNLEPCLLQRHTTSLDNINLKYFWIIFGLLVYFFSFWSYFKVFGLKIVFFGFLDAKPCRTIMKLPQKVISRSETCTICQKVQIHMQDIHPNLVEIDRQPKNLSFSSQNRVFWTPRGKTMQNHYEITSKSQFWTRSVRNLTKKSGFWRLVSVS